MNLVPAGASNVLISTAAVRKAGGFDIRLKHLADWDLWSRVLQSTRAASCPEALVAYVQHPASMHVAEQASVHEEARLLRELHRDGPITDFDHGVFALFLADGHRQAGRALRRAAAVQGRAGVRHLAPGLPPWRCRRARPGHGAVRPRAARAAGNPGLGAPSMGLRRTVMTSEPLVSVVFLAGRAGCRGDVAAGCARPTRRDARHLRARRDGGRRRSAYPTVGRRRCGDPSAMASTRRSPRGAHRGSRSWPRAIAGIRITSVARWQPSMRRMPTGSTAAGSCWTIAAT